VTEWNEFIEDLEEKNEKAGELKMEEWFS